jgi:chromosome segregation ATPase
VDYSNLRQFESDLRALLDSVEELEEQNRSLVLQLAEKEREFRDEQIEHDSTVDERSQAQEELRRVRLELEAARAEIGASQEICSRLSDELTAVATDKERLDWLDRYLIGFDYRRDQRIKDGRNWNYQIETDCDRNARNCIDQARESMARAIADSGKGEE